MRLSEAANLSWERFSEDHDGIQGMRCFSLLNTNDEIVAVKNKGSMRIIPLHPDLVLPPKGTGRLFDYKMNEDGLASHDAGRAINPTLQKCEHSQVVVKKTQFVFAPAPSRQTQSAV